MVDDLVEALGAELPRSAMATVGPRGSALHPALLAESPQLMDAWREVCAGEHGQALLYAFRVRAEKVVGPVEQREVLRIQVQQALEGLSDDAVRWLLDAGGDAAVPQLLADHAERAS